MVGLSLQRGITELGDITVHNIKQLKRINEVVFPVVYNDKFYSDILEVGELAKLGKCHFDHLRKFSSICWQQILILKVTDGIISNQFAAYFNDIVVGAVCCREDKSDNTKRLYIMTLGCLAPYRRMGIGENTEYKPQLYSSVFN